MPYVWLDNIKLSFTVNMSWEIEKLAAHPGTWRPVQRQIRDGLLHRRLVTVHPHHPRHVTLTELGVRAAEKFGVRVDDNPVPSGTLFSGTSCQVTIGDKPELVTPFGKQPSGRTRYVDEYWIVSGTTVTLMPSRRPVYCHNCRKTNTGDGIPAVTVLQSRPVCAGCATTP